MTRPERCQPRNQHKTWLTQEQAIRKAEQYGMNAYQCYDHFHIGHKAQPRRTRVAA